MADWKIDFFVVQDQDSGHYMAHGVRYAIFTEAGTLDELRPNSASHRPPSAQPLACSRVSTSTPNAYAPPSSSRWARARRRRTLRQTSRHGRAVRSNSHS